VQFVLDGKCGDSVLDGLNELPHLIFDNHKFAPSRGHLCHVLTVMQVHLGREVGPAIQSSDQAAQQRVDLRRSPSQGVE
jgi:hypothetical protein